MPAFGSGRALWALLAAAVAALAGLLWWDGRAVATDLGTARDLHGAAYVGSAACHKCHEGHDRSWRRTFHRTMTREAAADTVKGDFGGATLRYGGVTARMDRDAAGAYRMTFTPDDGAPWTANVARTVGSHRYQQYLALHGDAYVRLPVAWHVEDRRWFHMNGAFLTPDPPEPAPGRSVARADYDRHVTRWNDNCIFCHNVRPDPGLDADSGRFRSHVAELGVACEACHGPGGEHAARNRDPVRRYALHIGGRADPTIVNPSRLAPERGADLCGRCHGQRITDDVGRFMVGGDPFVPGDDLALYSAPLWRGTPLRGDATAFAPRFWPDGTARLTAYEYQGLLQSPCAQRGPMTCTSCHSMHDGDPAGQMAPWADGDAACTGCHKELADDAAKGRHAHHDARGAGARCVGCHMPRIVYGVLDALRSHHVEAPDPRRDAVRGRPDACATCHADEDAGWAAAAFARLWGGGGGHTAGAPATTGGATGSTTVATTRAAAGATATLAGVPAGSAGTAEAGAAPPASEGGWQPLAAALAGDPIERALAVDALGRSDVPCAPERRARRLGILLDVMRRDDYPAVRRLAWRSTRRLVERHHPGARPPWTAYEPTASAAERRRACDAIGAALPAGAVAPPDDGTAQSLRAQAKLVAIEIGE